MLDAASRPAAMSLPALSDESEPATDCRPHICFVAPEAWPVFSGDTEIKVVGGAEVQQSIIARLLAQAGYRVSMICLDYGQPERVSMHGVTLYKAHHPDAGIPGLRFIHPRLTTIWRVMREVDADIYYQRTASMLTAVVAAFCRRYRKLSIYAGASDPDFLPGRQAIRYRRDRWLFDWGISRVDGLVVQNQTQLGYCLQHYGRQAMLIPSCYELSSHARPGAGDSVLWVSTLRRQKRPELFLELAAGLPQLNFIMVGGPGGGADDAAYFESIRRQAAALPNVEFVGFLPLAQVEPYFDRAAVLVNTSEHEGMPNTFLQAWARGIPTVAFIDTGARHQNLPVYHIAENLGDAAAEIERLFADDLYRQRAARRCRAYFAETHAPADVLKHYQHLLDDLLGQERAWR